MNRFGFIVSTMAAFGAFLTYAPPGAGQYVVSAMAGYIHFAEGGVLLQDKPFRYNSAEFVHVGNGQHLRTLDGRAEIMLIPGSFIRLAPGSEFEMIQAGLLSAEMKLNQGSAVVDLLGAMDTDEIVLHVGDARLTFLKNGLYRLDLPPGGDAVIRVTHGKARVEFQGGKIDIGGKRELTLTPSDEKLRAARFDKLEPDELDRWNAERGKLLAVKAREENRDREFGRMEDSAIFRCRMMGIGCPSSPRPPQMPSPGPSGGGGGGGVGGGGGGGGGGGRGGGGRR